MSKLSSWLITFLLLPLLLPLAIIICLISLFIPIYFNRFDFGRIGHAYNAYYLIKMRVENKAKFITFNYLDSSTGIIANQSWLDLFARKFLIFPHMTFFLKKLTVVMKRLKLLKFVTPPFDTLEIYNKNYPYLKKPNEIPLLDFNENELSAGNEYLLKYNTKPYTYICFFSRDSSYLNQIDATRDWSYHDYRDSRIKNFSALVNHYAEKNVHLFRMGSKVQDLYNENNSFIHDYSNSSDRSDFLDVFLSAHCKFFILGDSGISIFPEIFARPIGYCNVVSISRFFTSSCFSLLIPKKYFSKSKKRALTFKEIFAMGDVDYTKEVMLKLDFELIENTEEEILDLALEIENKLSNKYVESPEEKALIEKYWAIHPRPFLRRANFNISGTYLLKNKNLLE